MSQTGRVSSAKGTDPGAATAPDFNTVRNVALVGHSGAGKTTSSRCCWPATAPFRGPDRSPQAPPFVTTTRPSSRQQRSVGLALAPLVSGEVKINLIDTPGYADFVGELRAGLRAADAALFVVSAVDPIDGATRLLWNECAAVAMPRAIVITKLDQPRADFAGLSPIARKPSAPACCVPFPPLPLVREATRLDRAARQKATSPNGPTTARPSSRASSPRARTRR